MKKGETKGKRSGGKEEGDGKNTQILRIVMTMLYFFMVTMTSINSKC